MKHIVTILWYIIWLIKYPGTWGVLFAIAEFQLTLPQFPVVIPLIIAGMAQMWLFLGVAELVYRKVF